MCYKNHMINLQVEFCDGMTVDLGVTENLGFPIAQTLLNKRNIVSQRLNPARTELKLLRKRNKINEY